MPDRQVTRLCIERIGPGASLQDLGRSGHLALGLSAGGAVDRRAIFEAATLLGQAPSPGIEMPVQGGKFSIESGSIVFALTGAPMRARIGDKILRWNATHRLRSDQELEIQSVERGTYGYLTFGGALDAPFMLGAQSAHLNAKIFDPLVAGDRFNILPGNSQPDIALPDFERFSGGVLRVVAGPQTNLFTDAAVLALTKIKLKRTAKANRMGVELDGGRSFGAESGLSVVSEMILPGDIQMTGEGKPFVLGPECQTTGGYPRIGTVIAPDLTRVFQASPGTEFTVRFVERDEAIAALTADEEALKSLSPKPIIRDPHDIQDLLAYQLIDGVYAEGSSWD